MPIIKNYGFLWDRKWIYEGTGGQGNSGHLKGYAPAKPIADFREQIGVYVLYDRDQQIVYVGQAGNGNATLFTRLKNHMSGELWNRWQYFTWVGFRDVNANGNLSNHQEILTKINNYTYAKALNEIEGILIEVIEPKLNKQSGKLASAVEYRQHIDERLQEVSNSELKEILRSIKSKIGK